MEETLAEWALSPHLNRVLTSWHFEPEAKAEPGTLEGAKACSLKRKLSAQMAAGSRTLKHVLGKLRKILFITHSNASIR